MDALNSDLAALLLLLLVIESVALPALHSFTRQHQANREPLCFLSGKLQKIFHVISFPLHIVPPPLEKKQCSFRSSHSWSRVRDRNHTYYIVVCGTVTTQGRLSHWDCMKFSERAKTLQQGSVKDVWPQLNVSKDCVACKQC